MAKSKKSIFCFQVGFAWKEACCFSFFVENTFLIFYEVKNFYDEFHFSGTSIKKSFPQIIAKSNHINIYILWSSKWVGMTLLPQLSEVQMDWVESLVNVLW